MISRIIFRHDEMPFVCRPCDTCESDTGRPHLLLEDALLFHLNEDTRILGKQDFNDIFFGYGVQIHFQSAFDISETHFEQCGDHPACRNVMSGKYQPFVDRFLYGIECVAEVIEVSDCRRLTAHFAERLCESRTAETESIEREIDIIYIGMFVAHKYGRNNLADIAHFTCSRDNHRAGRKDFVRAVFLGHRKRILASRDVDTECAGKIRCRLNSFVEPCILALISAGPHPVSA